MKQLRGHLWMSLLLWGALTQACDATSEGEIALDVQTDLVVGEEIDRMQVTLVPLSEDRPSLRYEYDMEGRYFPSARLAELEEIPEGSYRLQLAPYLAGTETLGASQRTLVEVRAGVLSVVVDYPRSCLSLQCGEEQGCRNGRCVDLACIGPEADEDLCAIEAQCSEDAACNAAGACALGRCIEGACWFEARASSDEAACEEGIEWCNPEIGCFDLGDDLPMGDSSALLVEESDNSISITREGLWSIVFSENIAWNIAEWIDLTNGAASLGQQGAFGKKYFQSAVEARYKPSAPDDWHSVLFADNRVSDLSRSVDTVDAQHVRLTSAWTWIGDDDVPWNVEVVYDIRSAGTVDVDMALRNGDTETATIYQSECAFTTVREVLDWDVHEGADGSSFTFTRLVNGEAVSRIDVEAIEAIGEVNMDHEDNRYFNNSTTQDLEPGEALRCQWRNRFSLIP